MSRKGCPNRVSKKIQFVCLQCNKTWLDYPSREGHKKFCSHSCRGKKHSSELAKRSIGNTWGSKRKITKELREKLSRIMRGKKRPNIAKSKSGALNPNWRGGVTPANKRIRRSEAFKTWRQKVFGRDNWTCVLCGERGRELHPDHIKPFAYFPALRFDIDNGRTLCVSCHRASETYGSKAVRLYALPNQQK